ncbi:MAG: hypothetical protein AB8G86_17570 [Saprospiraceae bacterium]
MTQKELKQRVKVTKDQITLAVKYKEAFEKELGYKDYIDERLELLKELLDKLKR